MRSQNEEVTWNKEEHIAETNTIDTDIDQIGKWDCFWIYFRIFQNRSSKLNKQRLRTFSTRKICKCAIKTIKKWNKWRIISIKIVRSLNPSTIENNLKKRLSPSLCFFFSLCALENRFVFVFDFERTVLGFSSISVSRRHWFFGVS